VPVGAAALDRPSTWGDVTSARASEAWTWYDRVVPPSDQTSHSDPSDDEPGATTSDRDDPTAIAEDGMAPFINNTGADSGDGADVDASSG
jgi:hypothetical protein